jgi:uncharacterized damage-inducible protein DinB
MPDRGYFGRLADYNRWANRRLFAAAAELDDAQRRRELGLFFGSLHDVLAHLVATDNAWLALLHGEVPQPLPDQATATFVELARMRVALDALIVTMVAAMTDDDFAATFQYTPWAGDFAGRVYRQPRRDVLAHLFNHHTHHRGQAHSALSLLGVAPPPLDLFVMQIGVV